MLVTIATIKAKPGSEAKFEKAALELEAAVNKNEEGCLLYKLCKGEEPGVYTFVERYKNQDAVEAHRKSDHFRTLGKAMGAFMDGPPQIQRLQQVRAD